MDILQPLRRSEVYVGTAKVARMMQKDHSWVLKNLDLFKRRRKNGGRSWEFEISSVLTAWKKIHDTKNSEQYREAS